MAETAAPFEEMVQEDTPAEEVDEPVHEGDLAAASRLAKLAALRKRMVSPTISQ